MKITIEINTFEELYKNCWGGALDTLKTIIENNKEEEFMDLLEGLYIDEKPTMTEINDCIWFDDDYIFECLEINLED